MIKQMQSRRQVMLDNEKENMRDSGFKSRDPK